LRESGLVGKITFEATGQPRHGPVDVIIGRHLPLGIKQFKHLVKWQR